MSHPSTVQFVMVTSKQCNLLCKYCYEYPDLSDPAALSLDQVESVFRRVRTHYEGVNEPLRIAFVWHGGEPLLIDPDFYWEAFERQRRVFEDSPHLVTHSVQTNLTKLDDRRLALLATGFDGVGVSIDFVGGLRVNRAGKPSEPRVLRNLDRLREAGVPFGGITVLTKNNLDFLAEIYGFYRAMQSPFRLLPLHRGPFESGQGFEIDAHDTLRAYCRLADLWLADAEMVMVSPIVDHLWLLLEAHRTGRTHGLYDKREGESIFLVDRDGSLYGYSEAFQPDYRYGNLIEQPLGELLKSSGHERALASADARVAATCKSCPRRGRGCTGYPIAEGGQEYDDRTPDGAFRCTATKGLLAHLERRLTQAGILGTSQAADLHARMAGKRLAEV